jgi:exopolyphosphatase/guanosine-5'-triphosphate,3'-diphosphate pyrophosphatase
MNLSVIDLGSSALRLLTAAPGSDGRLVRLDGTREPLRLGRDVFERGTITDAALDEAVDAVGRALRRARRAGARRVAAVTTSPLREADNGTTLLARVRREHGLRLEVLSGEDEAVLSYRGARSALERPAGRLAVVKLGNGSVELAAGDGPLPTLAFSLPSGALRLRDLLGLEAAPLRPRHVDLLRERVQEVAAPALAEVRAWGPRRVALTSGTARGVAGLAASLRGSSPGDGPLSLADVQRVVQVLTRASAAALDGLRARVPRLDTFGVGAVVLAALLELLGADEAEVVDRGFREGVALREADRLRHAAAAAVQASPAQLAAVA